MGKKNQLTNTLLGGAALFAVGTAAQAMELGSASCVLGGAASGSIGTAVGVLLHQAGNIGGGLISNRLFDRYKALKYELNDPTDVLRNQYLCRLVTQAIALSIRETRKDVDRKDPVFRILIRLEEDAKTYFLENLQPGTQANTNSGSEDVSNTVNRLNLSESQIERFFTGDWDDFARVDSPSKLQWQEFLTEAANNDANPAMRDAIEIASSSLELHFPHMLFNNAKIASKDDQAAFASLELMLIRTLATTLSQHGDQLENINASTAHANAQLQELRRDLRTLRESLSVLPSRLETRLLLPDLLPYGALQVSAQSTYSLVPDAVSSLDTRISSIEALVRATYEATSEIRDVIIGDRKMVSKPPAVDETITDHANREWTIRELLSEGVAGCVALAEHRGKHTVFKVIVSEDFARGFGREVEAATALQNSDSSDARFCRIIDSKLPNQCRSVADDAAVTPPFWVQLEYFSLGNLSQWWRTKPYQDETREPVASRLMVEIARTVQLAHDLGVLHRDLKPSNILMGIQADGEMVPYISDFGIASFSDPERSVLLSEHAGGNTIQSSTIDADAHLGTLLYMAPELYERSVENRPPAPPSKRTEIFSLGVVLYWLLTGRQERPTRELVQSQVEDRFLGYIIRRATHRDPERRFRSVSEFADAIDARAILVPKLTDLEDELLTDTDRLALERERLQASQEQRERADRERERAEHQTARAFSLVRRLRYAVAGLVLISALAIIGFVIAQERTEGERLAKLDAKSNLESANQRLSLLQKILDANKDTETILLNKGVTAAREHLATSTINIFKEMNVDQNTDTWVNYELAKRYLSMGQILRLQNNDIDETRSYLDNASQMFQYILNANPFDKSSRTGLSRTHLEFANLNTAQGDFEEARNHLLLVTEIASQLQAGHTRQLIDVEILLIEAKISLLNNRFIEAIRVAEEAKGITSALLDSGELDEYGLYADALRIQAEAERRKGHYDRSVELYEELVGLRTTLCQQHPADAVLRRGLIRDLLALGRFHVYDLADYESARSNYDSSYRHAERLVLADTQDGIAQDLLLEVYGAKVSLLRREGSYAESAREARLLIDQAKRYAEEDPGNDLKARRVYAKIFDTARALEQKILEPSVIDDTDRQELIAEATSMYEEATSGYKEIVSAEADDAPTRYRAEHADIMLQSAKFFENLARRSLAPNSMDRASELYQDSISAYEQLAKAYLLDKAQIANYAVACRNLGTLYLNGGDGELAVTMLERADKIREKRGWSVYARKGDAYRLAGNCEEAIRYANLAVEDLKASNMAQERKNAILESIQEFVRLCEDQ